MSEFDSNQFDNERRDQPRRQQPEKGWFERNWLWLVPVLVLMPVLVCGGCFMALFGGVMTALKSSDAYSQSLAKAKASPEVKAALGENIEPGILIQGNINIQNDEGNVNINYSITGTKGEGTVNCAGLRKKRKWTFDTMTVTVKETGEVINLHEGDWH